MPAVGPGTNPPGLERKKQQAEAGKGGVGGAVGGTLSGLARLGSGGSMAGTLSEALERQAATQKMQAQRTSNMFAPQDPISKLMQDFMGQYRSINVAPTPLEQLQRLAEQQVAAQFDPAIQALSQQMSQKSARGKQSQAEARQMYGDLSKDFLAAIPEMTQQFAQEDLEANARYDTAQKQLQDMYGQQSRSQNAVLQQLGIQAAAPEASQQAQADQSYFQGSMEADQQAFLNAMKEQQQAAQTYQGQLGSTTRLAGENTAQDIMRQLEDYLGAAGQQMTGLQSQRGSALAGLLQQVQSQDAQRVQQEEQQQFQNLMDLSRFQMDAANAQARNTGRQTSNMITTNLGQAQNFLAQQYPNQPNLASGLMEQLQDVLANPDVVRGKFELQPGNKAYGRGPTYSDVGQEMMFDLLRKEIEQANIDQPGRYGAVDINNAIQAMMAYLGKTAR